MTYEEFAGREGDVVTGIVQQSERRYTLLDLGKVEASPPQAEQVPSEPDLNGERLKGYITEVRKGRQGPADRRVAGRDPGLLKKLFELEGAEDRRGYRRDQGGLLASWYIVRRSWSRPTSPWSTGWARAWARRARACATW